MPVYGTPSLRLRHPPYDLRLCDWYCGAAKGIVPGAGLRCSRYLRQRARLWQTISREACGEAVLLLPPLSGPTQVGTTPGVGFRAVVGLDGTACAFEVASKHARRLACPRPARWRKRGLSLLLDDSTDIPGCRIRNTPY